MAHIYKKMNIVNTVTTLLLKTVNIYDIVVKQQYSVIVIVLKFI